MMICVLQKSYDAGGSKAAGTSRTQGGSSRQNSLVCFKRFFFFFFFLNFNLFSFEQIKTYSMN